MAVPRQERGVPAGTQGTAQPHHSRRSLGPSISLLRRFLPSVSHNKRTISRTCPAVQSIEEIGSFLPQPAALPRVQPHSALPPDPHSAALPLLSKHPSISSRRAGVKCLVLVVGATFRKGLNLRVVQPVPCLLISYLSLVLLLIPFWLNVVNEI